MSSYIVFLSCSGGLQGEDTWADSEVHYGGRARGRGTSDEGGDVIFMPDEGARIRHAL